MEAAVLVPWRPGCPHREAAWAWLHPRLEASWPVIEGRCEHGPWVKADAVADALTRTTADVLIVHDADVWADNLPDVVARVEPGRWVIPHRHVHRLDQPSTAAVLAGGPVEGKTTERPYRGHPGGGVVALHRTDYERTPLDPRFAGWGQEDDAWALALTRTLGGSIRLNADLWHLWHPPQDRRSRVSGSRANVDLFLRYRQARTPAAMAQLLAEVTDGREDQAQPQRHPPAAAVP